MKLKTKLIWVSFGIFIISLVLFTYLIVDADPVILHPGYIEGIITLDGFYIDGGQVGATSIGYEFNAYDYDIAGGIYSLTVEGGYEYNLGVSLSINESDTSCYSLTRIGLASQSTDGVVEEGETASIDFSMNPALIDASVTVTGGTMTRAYWGADYSIYNGYRNDVIKEEHCYGSPISAHTVFPAAPFKSIDANGDGDYDDSGDSYIYAWANVWVDGNVYVLPHIYIDEAIAGETTLVHWDLDVTPGTLTGTVTVGDEEFTDYFIKGTAIINGNPVSTGGQAHPYGSIYSVELPAVEWTLYPTIRWWGSSSTLSGSLSLMSIPESITILAGQTITRNWNINPGYVQGTINILGASTEFYSYAMVYADSQASSAVQNDANFLTTTNDYEMVLYPGTWIIGQQYMDLNFDYDSVETGTPYTSFMRVFEAGLPVTEVSAGIENTVQNVDFTYGTALVTVKLAIEGGGLLHDPKLSFTHSANPYNFGYGYGHSDERELGEVTATVLAGNNRITVNAYVADGSFPKFADFYIDVEAGDIIVHDLGAPFINLTTPVGYEHVTETSILVEGTATDDSGIENITVNGASIPFTVTGNPDHEVSFSTTVEGLTYGENAITVVATDTASPSNATSVERTIYCDYSNTPPSVLSIVGPAEPLSVGTPVEMTGTYSDPDTGDTHVSTWDWGDGNSPTTGTAAGGNAFGTYMYGTPGVYTVTLTITDGESESSSMSYQYVVIYDASAGFITGGGWIDSPAGAYAPDPALSGKANLGFVAKYQAGASEPTGITEFQFKAGDLNFHSTSYQWLVIAGETAQFKGNGKINNEGDYKFKIWAKDGGLLGAEDPDTFRIKIWEEDEYAVETVIYDNDVDSELGGGNIKIHE